MEKYAQVLMGATRVYDLVQSLHVMSVNNDTIRAESGVSNIRRQIAVFIEEIH